MNQKARELWLIPSIISLGSGTLFLILSIYISAWATGASLRAPFTLALFKAVLVYRLPLWEVLLFGAFFTIVTISLRNRAGDRRTKDADPHFIGDAISSMTDEPLQSIEKNAAATIAQNLPLASAVAESLLFESPDLFAVRIEPFDNGDIKGIQLKVENYRLTSIHHVRVTLISASSFDSRHQAYREATVSNQIFQRPQVIQASGSGQPINLLWKGAQWKTIVTGDNNMVYRLSWPEHDKSQMETWKIALKVVAYEQKKDVHGNFIALKELPIDISVTWEREQNVFAIRNPLAEPTDVPGFPKLGEDGISRNTVRYIMCGLDQLMAYTITRQGLPGTRFLVVRARPNSQPQSLETSDSNAANAQWTDWYLDWKKRGFGGASGTGLDGATPFV